MKKILVTGGAGYIGSHTIIELLNAGFEVVSIDNYVNSEPETYDRIEKITGKRISYYDVDLCDREKTLEIFRKEAPISGVIHFAALKSVPDSVANPVLYFHNNNESLLNVADASMKTGVNYLIFSSSCSVYGNVEPEMLPVNENTPLQMPESPYGYTKLMGENMLRFLVDKGTFEVISLRYFNPVGAHESGLIGELASKRVNNLVPVITQSAIGIRKEFTVFGDDYNTRDGSCIRDYIHVVDIADAHVKAIQYQMSGKQEQPFDIFNLGTGNGVSVFEAINAFERVSGIKPPYSVGGRREGDVEAIYSDSSRAAEMLGWKPNRGIDEMMRSAWEWQKYMVENNMIA